VSQLGLKRIAALAALVSIVWFALLAVRPLYDPDEGRYAEIPREMLATGDWVIPHLNGLVYLEKPPLGYWLGALSLACCGPSEASARLVTGVAGFFALALLFALARRLWGIAAGVRAVLLALGSVLFVLLGHQLTLDMLLTACLLAALSCFIFAQLRPADDRRCRAWMLGCWAALALAVLTKGLIGVVIPGCTLLGYTLLQRHFDIWRRLHWRSGLPVFLLIAAPWFVLAARADGEFLRFFFIREHFQRFLTPIEQRSQPPWFFVPVLVVGVLPWISLILAQLLGGWRASTPRGVFDVQRLLWVWSAFVLVFFSVSNSKLIPYILPAIPALALLCAAQRAPVRHFQIGAALSLVFALGVLGYAGGAIGSVHGRPLALVLRPALVMTSTVLTAGAIACFVYSRRGRALAAQSVLSAAWFGAAIAVTLGAIRAESFFSAKDIAAAILRDEASRQRDEASILRDEASRPRDGASILREEASRPRDGASILRDEASLRALPPAVPVADGLPFALSAAGTLPFAPASVAVGLPGSGTPVFAVQTYAQSLPYYLRHDVVLVDYRDEFDLGLREQPWKGLAHVAEFAALWTGLASGYALMPEATLARLREARLPCREVEHFPNAIVLIARR